MPQHFLHFSSASTSTNRAGNILSTHGFSHTSFCSLKQLIIPLSPSIIKSGVCEKGDLARQCVAVSFSAQKRIVFYTLSLEQKRSRSNLIRVGLYLYLLMVRQAHGYHRSEITKKVKA